MAYSGPATASGPPSAASSLLKKDSPLHLLGHAMAAGTAPRARKGPGAFSLEQDSINAAGATATGTGKASVTPKGGNGGISELLYSSLRRLNDPQDTVAACAVSGCLLVFEALLCSAILVKVPCTLLPCTALPFPSLPRTGGPVEITVRVPSPAFWFPVRALSSPLGLPLTLSLHYCDRSGVDHLFLLLSLPDSMHWALCMAHGVVSPTGVKGMV